MKIKLVIVNPIYQINLGYIARASKNFGLDKLYIVDPKCDYRGKQAIRFSKHARDLLENAAVFKDLESAIKGDKFVVGTTAIWKKSEDVKVGTYRLEEFKDKFRDLDNITILIGRDNKGLTQDELRKCNASIFIEGNPDYTTLNISHAVSIILYELTKSKFNEGELSSKLASDKDISSLIYLFDESIDSNKSIRDKKGVKRVFSNILKRANPKKDEVNTLKILFSKRQK